MALAACCWRAAADKGAGCVRARRATPTTGHGAPAEGSATTRGDRVVGEAARCSSWARRSPPGSVSSPTAPFRSSSSARSTLRGLPYQTVNAGVSGETSAGLLRRLDWVLQRPAEVIVVETGANDGLRGQPVTATQATIGADPGSRFTRSSRRRGCCWCRWKRRPTSVPSYTRRSGRCFRRWRRSTG